MESPREPLPPIVDPSLIEAPFEIAVLGSSLRVSSDPEREAQGELEARESTLTARELRKAARREAKLARKQSTPREEVSPHVDAKPETSSSRRGLSFDDLIGGGSS